jgi:transcription elongation factor GreA
VGIGCTVKVLDVEFDEELEYRIVGSQEADPMQGRISEESPFGKAMLGKAVGDTAIVEAPEGNVEYKVLDITVN